MSQKIPCVPNLTTRITDWHFDNLYCPSAFKRHLLLYQSQSLAGFDDMRIITAIFISQFFGKQIVVRFAKQFLGPFPKVRKKAVVRKMSNRPAISFRHTHIGIPSTSEW